ncbi:DNA repair protein RecN [Nocardioides daphniae]|uniref:DNA repair protein RecN n=1 Tax=Nocardioides daphniae TaxID=402297 RepID=A0A4V1CWG3_9ACTN|nr:DNA repair protein RecN [Nocardioides daphniae]QCC77167.1 DNA repair protein RecN [Nocardioides daphniae]GGD27221.1 DNA repair protein RecN [Nocardioides daphniae]
MFEEIRISQLGVIDSSTLELGPGFTVITGETGAGKTMVVTALGLLLGGRADSGAVRRGATSARVEGVVVADGLTDFVEQVEEHGGEPEDGRVVLARNISAEGRSRAWVGGAGVPAAKLAQVAEPLVAVHGQSDQHRLLKPAAQREALDRFAGEEVARLGVEFADAWRHLAGVERELHDVVSSARERAREADQLRFALEEIEKVSPEPGEDTVLAAEETRLGFADTLRVAAETAREALSSEHGTPDALGATAAARGALEGVREHDPEAAGLADRLAELTYLLSDLAADVASYASNLDTDPLRLAAVSERRAALIALTRKYGETIDEVLEWSGTAAQRLTELDDTDGRIEELKAARAEARATVARLGAELSRQRTAAAVRLGQAVSDELTLLAMPHATLEVTVTQQEAAPPTGEPSGPVIEVDGRHLRGTVHGFDDVELLLAANAGMNPRPLDKGASGGELSRVMLAVEVVLAATTTVPTFVFDEVDAGVGGKAAIEIGRRLATLARNAQVLVVTHLPQVAAFADRHIVVAKSSDGSVTTSGLHTLAEEERERELSRMLAGLEDSDTALAHARELIEAARATR